MADAALTPPRLDRSAFLAFRSDPRTAQPITQVRSTILVAGMKRLRETSHYDAFLAELPTATRGEMMTLAGGRWIDPQLAHAYYGALDALNLSHRQILELTTGVASRLKDSFLSLALQASREVGITPWSALSQTHAFIDRVMVGSDIEVAKLGPKDARLVWVGNPFARHRYFRLGILGSLPALLGAFCQRAFVREIPQLHGETTLAYRAAWV